EQAQAERESELKYARIEAEQSKANERAAAAGPSREQLRAERESEREYARIEAAEKRPGATRAKYARIKTGMSYAEVVAIIGTSGEELSRSELAGHTTVMYQWKGTGISNMNAMFQNGGLITKAQFGLR
ncbi:hypothetical protein LCGC14_2686760, partial [marine sediment metagenome]